MAQIDRINLMNEFEKVQSDNDFIILTTYTFDPFFFDAFLLKQLEMNNIGSEIVVIVDATQYIDSYPRFTNLTGRSYRLVPVFLHQGVFHPKVFLFFSEKRNEATLYVGSCNLTLQGFTNNAEVVAKFNYCLKNEISKNLFSAINMFSLLSASLVRDKNVGNILKDLQESPVLKNLRITDEEEAHFMHNVEVPILNQLKALVRGSRFDSLIILAPFISENSILLGELLTDIEVEKVIMCLQRGNHNVTDISDIQQLCKRKGIKFDISDAYFKDPQERGRRFHSKILYFKGEEDILLVGSPNFTISALMKTVMDGNFECGILYKGHRCKDIISEIVINRIDDVDELLATATKPDQRELGNTVKVYSAYFDRIFKKLNIETEVINADTEIIVTTEQPSSNLSYKCNLSSGKVLIDIDKGFPIEAVIIKDTRQTPIRIFQDKNYFIKRITRSLSLTDISDLLFHDLSLNATDLIVLMANFVAGIQTNEILSHSQESMKPHEKTPIDKPSREGCIGSMSGLLKTLAQIYEMLSINRVRQISEDNLRDDFDDHNTRIKNLNYVEYNEQSKLIKKIIMLLDLVLREWSSRNGNNPDSVILYQTTLLHYYLKLFRTISPDKEVMKFVIEQLDHNLSETRFINSQKESKIKLFSYLVTFHYLCRIQENPSFVNNIFKYEDIIPENIYLKARQLSENIFSTLKDTSFDGDIFAWWYAKLARNCINTDIHEKIVKLCADIDKHEGEYLHMLVQLLKNLKNAWHITQSMKNDISNLSLKPSSLDLIQNILGPLSNRQASLVTKRSR